MWDVLIYVGLASVASAGAVAAWIIASSSSRSIECLGEAIECLRGAEMAKFAEPYIEVRCEVQGACRLAFTRAEWEEMDDRERDRAVRDAAMVGASVAWRYAPSGREGAAK